MCVCVAVKKQLLHAQGCQRGTASLVVCVWVLKKMIKVSVF